jgi:membrane associated rhomboid family serine protease
MMQAGQPLVLVGASGGVLGVAGALLADALLNRSGADMTLVRSLLQWMALILLFSVLPGVSLWGHAGGVLGGFVYGAVRGRVPGRATGTVLGSVAAGLLALALFSAVSTMVPLLP